MSMFVGAVGGWVADDASRPPLRIGMIGLDTSHVPAFAKLFNDPQAQGDLAGMRVILGYPGGTDIPASRDRVEGFTQQVQEMGVEIVQTIPELLDKVDGVLLLSVDGRIHLEEATAVIQAGKPLFVDKPIAGSLADAIMIFELAKQHNVPCFSASSLRFNPSIQALLRDDEVGEVAGAMTWSSCTYQAGIPDMFFYGVHGIEALYTLMGAGCETVTRLQTPDTDVISGVWRGGRIGTYRGIRKNQAEFGAVVFGSKAIVTADPPSGYEALCKQSYEVLCKQIGRFFKMQIPPVDAETTIEIFAFMEAADVSRRRDGEPVSIAEILEKARHDATERLHQCNSPSRGKT